MENIEIIMVLCAFGFGWWTSYKVNNGAYIDVLNDRLEQTEQDRDNLFKQLAELKRKEDEQN